MRLWNALYPVYTVTDVRMVAGIPSFQGSSRKVVSYLSRAVLEGLWLRFHGEQVELCVRREQRRRVLQTLLWFTVTLILALFIPDIGRVIALIGGLAACFIFVFPGIIIIILVVSC